MAYRSVAARAAMLYFLLNDLWKVNQMYHFSLKAFLTVFFRYVLERVNSHVHEVQWIAQIL